MKPVLGVWPKLKLFYVGVEVTQDWNKIAIGIEKKTVPAASMLFVPFH